MIVPKVGRKAQRGSSAKASAHIIMSQLCSVTMMRMLIVYAPIFLAHLYRHAKRSALVMMVGKQHEHEQHHCG